MQSRFETRDVYKNLLPFDGGKILIQEIFGMI